MAKKNIKRQTQKDESVQYVNSVPRPEFPVPVPEVINMDDLAVMLDDELYARLTALDADRNKVLDARLDASMWETETAYVRRELQLRRSRRDAHDTYLREQARLFAEEERDLPSADFDNIKFVMAAYN